MAKIIIEEVNRLGHVTGRHSFDHFPLAIGRGYQNDLIIDDPFVSAEHVTINEVENGWRVEDKQSDNGIKLRLHSPQSRNDLLVSGDEFIVGRTRLRLISPWHPVPKTHILPARTSLPKVLAHPALSTGIVFVTLALLLLEYQLSVPVKTGFEKLIASVFPTFIFALAWAGIWAFVGRVITHRASFLPHFIAALLVFIISLLVSTLSEYLTYNLHSTLLSTLVEFVVVGFILAGLLYVNLSNSTNLSKQSSLVTSHSVAWSMLLMGLFMQYVNKPDFTHVPEYSSQLKPPFAKIASSKSLDDFIKDSEVIFVDQRKE